MAIQILQQDGIKVLQGFEPVLLQFSGLLKHQDKLKHCFTSRLGGTSTGECESLNLGFNRNDSIENVEANYLRVCDAMGIQYKDMVLSNQVHDNRIRKVSVDDRGKGTIRISDIKGYDGLITNETGIAITTFYADCVPLFFFDPNHRVIASVHSGWRGTLKFIGPEAVKMMKQDYGSSSGDIIAVIGPSIRKCCFEVGYEVYEEFIKKQAWTSDYAIQRGDRWFLDLQGIIRKSLEASGLQSENIQDCGICTKCNNDVFFSHRADMGKTGSMCAIMQLI